jgi:hypothetical protein
MCSNFTVADSAGLYVKVINREYKEHKKYRRVEA